ncbi:MAG: BREX-1 system phosphatase PglZ type A [Gammaproteobacteria bacterium]|nr:BREX-1 system phosphatase PglZ type A [Gammaproteobacteria bacterium]
MESRIAQALLRLFERHRIVFWYDAKHELRADFEALSLPDVECIEIQGNEFAIKHRVLREAPEQRFLLFHDGPMPEDRANWLLDVRLAHGEFRADQVALWLAELELGVEFSEAVSAHAEFFSAAKRKEGLRRLLQPDDTAGQLRQKMLAVCAGTEARIETVLEGLLQELAEGRDERLKLIARCELDGFFWDQLSRHFGYRSSEPGLRDFVIELFKSCYRMGTDGEVKLAGDALVFLRRWKDSRQYEQGFQTLSADCAEVLGIEQDLAKRDFRELIDLDYFELIDQKILSDLVGAVVTRTVSRDDVSRWVRQRRQGHWYAKYGDLYDAVDAAARFVAVLGEASLEMDGVMEGVERYRQSWYRLDQLYRTFIYHLQVSSQATLLTPLFEQIENLYTNGYLLKLNDRFQQHIDTLERWESGALPLQRRFFQRWVKPFVAKEVRVGVIVSDALRYEIADELLARVRREDRFSAELDAALSMLPSYTQLGMAALLPNQELTIADNDSASVLVDGASSQGTENRAKILAAALNGAADAVTAETLLGLGRDDCRELIKANAVLYVYHNRIDHAGDKRHSEAQAFEAAEQALDDLIKLVKKLSGNNLNNILITADHGFLYQHRPLEESDFSASEAAGEQVLYRDRRFVLGKGLQRDSGLTHFGAEQLGLAGDMEVLIPKSINRLRLKGSGSRFVHGGATLQEVVIPVLKINKKRQSDLATVDIEILRGGNAVITSGQLAVSLYQAQPVSDKMQPRVLRAGIYTEAGELISDSHDLTFDLDSESPRARELQVRFVLSRAADSANGQEVILKLEEQHAGTSHYKTYKSMRYRMRRSFTSDFDF